jgi:prevent-host-death family protein
VQVNIYEAKTRLSELVDQAHHGETIVIAKNGTPMAKLVSLDAAPRKNIVFGLMKGEIEIADDFDVPLPDDLQALFEGRDPAEPPAR